MVLLVLASFFDPSIQVTWGRFFVSFFQKRQVVVSFLLLVRLLRRNTPRQATARH